MRIPDEQVIRLVQSIGRLGSDQIEALKEQQRTEKLPLQALVIKNNLVTEAELTKLYAFTIEVPYIEYDPKAIPPNILKLVPERIAKQYNVVVFGKTGSELQVAMADPDDVQTVNLMRSQLGNDIKIHITTSSLLSATLDQYRGSISSELTKVIPVDENADADIEVKAEDLAENSPIAQTINVLIEYAVKSNASDIHIEPRENFIVVRYRVDGILREVNKLPRKVIGALISRVKILSNLKIDERRVPQDGRFKVNIGDHVYALRVSTLPVSDGEKIVMRILNESARASTLKELGYWGSSLANFEKAISKPHGMILVTGPTGSGKSTSLYSALSILNKPSVNISTIEDPIEYKIVGANQTQVNPQAGMTFVKGLRALLRQDPNIIMVGEIRDAETANLGIQAALTGHLVFSTLHTNNAATSLPRLLDMGIEPFLIASTVRAVVGQRLIRRLCVSCRERHVPEQVIIDKLGQIFSLDTPESLQKLHQLELQAVKEELGGENASPELSTTNEGITHIWRAKDGGCDKCSGTGYKGRLGIYEVLDNTSEVQDQIIGSSTSEQIQTTALANGMLSMLHDGFIKSLRGLTSLEEVLRVTSES